MPGRLLCYVNVLASRQICRYQSADFDCTPPHSKWSSDAPECHVAQSVAYKMRVQQRKQRSLKNNNEKHQ